MLSLKLGVSWEQIVILQINVLFQSMTSGSILPNTTMASLIPSFLTFGLLPSFFSAVMPYGQSPIAGQNTEAFVERTFFYVGGQYVNYTFVSLPPVKCLP